MSNSWSTKFNSLMEYLWGVNTITVSPTSVIAQLGVTIQFSTGDIPATWSSSNEAVATIDSNGLATVVGASGSTTITATAIANPSNTATATITVSGNTVKRIVIHYV